MNLLSSYGFVSENQSTSLSGLFVEKPAENVVAVAGQVHLFLALQKPKYSKIYLVSSTDISVHWKYEKTNLQATFQ